MKILYLTDSHFDARGPSSRADDYAATCLKKLEEVAVYARASKIKLIVHGGDFFDSPKPSYTMLISVLSLLARYGEISWLINVGNHDLFGWNPDTYPRTALKILEFLPHVRIMKDREYQPIAPNIFLCPIWSKFEREGDPAALSVGERPAGSYVITLPHTMLVERTFVAPHVPFERIAWATTGDLILGSHYHPGWPIRTIETSLGRRTLANPGSLLRTTRTSSERMPCFLTIEIDEQTLSLAAIKTVALQCAQPNPFKEDAPVIESMAHPEAPRFDEFMRELQGAKLDLSNTEPRTLATKIAQDGGFSEGALKRVLNNLEKVRMA